MNSTKTTLIIIRGPAGSGKSTVAGKLQKVLPNIALIDQDYYRKILLQHGPGSKELTIIMMKEAALTALSKGYHVIIEGILNLEHANSMFDELFVAHTNDNHMFYLNVPFKETVKRHNSRSRSEHFGEEMLQQWFSLSAPSKRDEEHLVPSNLTADETVQLMQKITKLS